MGSPDRDGLPEHGIIQGLDSRDGVFRYDMEGVEGGRHTDVSGPKDLQGFVATAQWSGQLPGTCSESV